LDDTAFSCRSCDRDGQVLDGRNRLIACRRLGISCPERTFEGDDGEILAFVCSMNLHGISPSASGR
jgi:hypothetical protein